MAKHRPRKAFELKTVEAQWPTEDFNKIAFVGEAPGETEARKGVPFVGSAGDVLQGLLDQSGIKREASLVTNVFTQRPPQNNVGYFFTKKKDADFRSEYPAFQQHGYISPQWVHELERLRSELEAMRPNVVVALGATALWALTGQDKIGKLRGAPLYSTLVDGLKVVPTYHPAAILRNWDFRPVTGADLVKAKQESEFPEIKRVVREVWIEPTLEDIYEFERLYMQDVKALAVDVETDPWTLKQITCVGFAPDWEHALVIPFVDKRTKSWSYWSDPKEETDAWEWVRAWLEDERVPKLGQNYAYDMMWFWKHGILNRGEVHDTMLLHHALQPELPKGLKHLGSMYTNEVAWGTMVNWKEHKQSA